MVNWQDGSYSRGPLDIPVGDIDDSKYYLSPTFKFEQVSFASNVSFIIKDLQQIKI